jgi:hypothetical protein
MTGSLLYDVYEYDGQEEFTVGNFNTFEEAYNEGFLWTLDTFSENLFDESRGEYYSTYFGGWFTPDDDDDEIYESECIFLPSKIEIQTQIEKTGRFEFKLLDDDEKCSIVIRKT